MRAVPIEVLHKTTHQAAHLPRERVDDDPVLPKMDGVVTLLSDRVNTVLEALSALGDKETFKSHLKAFWVALKQPAGGEAGAMQASIDYMEKFLQLTKISVETRDFFDTYRPNSAGVARGVVALHDAVKNFVDAADLTTPKGSLKVIKIDDLVETKAGEICSAMQRLKSVAEGIDPKDEDRVLGIQKSTKPNSISSPFSGLADPENRDQLRTVVRLLTPFPAAETISIGLPDYWRARLKMEDQPRGALPKDPPISEIEGFARVTRPLLLELREAIVTALQSFPPIAGETRTERSAGSESLQLALRALLNIFAIDPPAELTSHHKIKSCAARLTSSYGITKAFFDSAVQAYLGDSDDSQDLRARAASRPVPSTRAQHEIFALSKLSVEKRIGPARDMAHRMTRSLLIEGLSSSRAKGLISETQHADLGALFDSL